MRNVRHKNSVRAVHHYHPDAKEISSDKDTIYSIAQFRGKINSLMKKTQKSEESMKPHETLPEDIERRVGRALWNIRASGEGLDDATVVRTYRRAYAKYRAAVMGDDTYIPDIGMPTGYITETYIKKEAWRRYAEERKIELD